MLTGSNGRATVHYTLATVSGQQTIEARAKPVVPSASLTTTFSLTAMPESATGLIMAGGDDQVGERANGARRLPGGEGGGPLR